MRAREKAVELLRSATHTGIMGIVKCDAAQALPRSGGAKAPYWKHPRRAIHRSQGHVWRSMAGSLAFPLARPAGAPSPFVAPSRRTAPNGTWNKGRFGQARNGSVKHLALRAACPGNFGSAARDTTITRWASSPRIGGYRCPDHHGCEDSRSIECVPTRSTPRTSCSALAAREATSLPSRCFPPGWCMPSPWQRLLTWPNPPGPCFHAPPLREHWRTSYDRIAAAASLPSRGGCGRRRQ